MLKTQGFFIFFALFLASCATPEDFYYLRDTVGIATVDMLMEVNLNAHRY
jgi:hypothetical protein